MSAKLLSKQAHILIAAAILGWLLGGIMIGLGDTIHYYHNSDSVMHSLCSTETWTPYFWGQDRLGMFFSLLARPIRNPVDNLLVLNTMFAFATLAMFPLWGWWLTSSRLGLMGGALASFFVGTLALPYELFTCIFEHPEYPGSLFLATAGLLLVNRATARSRVPTPLIAPGLLLLLVAAWVNITVPVLLGGLSLLKWWAGKRRVPLASDTPTNTATSVFCWEISALVLSFLAVLIPTRLWVHSHMTTSLSLAAPWRIITGWFILHGRAGFHMPVICGASLAVLVVFSIRSLLHNRRRKHSLWRFRMPKAAMISLLGAVGFALFFACLKHVGNAGHGQYRPCYMIPSAFSLLLGAGILVASRIPRKKRKHAILVISLLFPLLGLITRGWPDRSGVLETFDRKWGDTSREIISQTEVTHIGGISWFTFDSLFYTNHLLHEAGSTRKIYPLAFRDGPMQSLWKDLPKERLRIATTFDYDWRADYSKLQKTHGITIEPAPVYTGDHIKVYRTIAPTPSP